MEAINFIKRYQKEYIGDNIDYDYKDEHNRNYLFYEMSIMPLSKYLLNNCNHNIEGLNISNVFQDLIQNNNENNNNSFVIPNDFINLKNIIIFDEDEYDDEDKYDDEIYTIYIENNKNIYNINCYDSNIILLNDNMHINKIICNSLICENCFLDYVKVNVCQITKPNNINELNIHDSYSDIILENLIINKLLISYPYKTKNIKIINCTIKNVEIIESQRAFDNIYYGIPKFNILNTYNINIENSIIDNFNINYYYINLNKIKNINIINSQIKTFNLNNCILIYPNNIGIKLLLTKERLNKIDILNKNLLNIINIEYSTIDNFNIDNYIDNYLQKYKTINIIEKSFNIKYSQIDKLNIKDCHLDNLNLNNNNINKIIIYDNNYDYNKINNFKITNKIKKYSLISNDFNLYTEKYNIEDIINNKKVIIKHNEKDINKEKYEYIEINNYKFYVNNEEVIIFY